MSTDRIKRWAKAGISLACAGLCGLTILLMVSAQQAMAQGETILPVALKAAEHLPTDVVRLCLVGMIVMALALVSVVGIFVKAQAVQGREFAAVVRGFADKPCVMDSEQGLAIMRDLAVRAGREARVPR